MNGQLATWQTRLTAHFTELHRRRCSGKPDQPIFALEHGLDLSEVQTLESDVRAHVASNPPSKEHELAWIVYAAEIGYGYAGDEYWQTFEKKTPGWINYNGRDWLRNCYRSFHKRFGGAKPSGIWAKNFSIICWPITHAILPLDLQRQLARILFELRHSFTAELFESPSKLGEFVAARSWNATSRFQNLAQETQLVGLISAALLLQGEYGTGSLIHPLTLQRISADLDLERRTREWLRGAQKYAKKGATIRGLSLDHAGTRGTASRYDAARAEVAALGIEPRLVLRPTDAERKSWEVSLEIPDLTHLLYRFPNTRKILTNSRCRVAGASGRPLARGRCLHGAQRVLLTSWPRQDEVLLQFEQTEPQLEYLLSTECLLRPGPTWLFRIASDRLAYEMRSLRVRPDEQYIIVTAGPPTSSNDHTHPIKLACEGVHAVLLDIPSELSIEWEETLRSLGLGQAKTIEVWPAGLAAVVWDGEGHGEWLASDRPCLAICSDHPIAALVISLGTSADNTLEFTSVTPGDPIYIELPLLPVGLHRVRVCTRSIIAGEAELLGDLEVVMRIRESRPWSPGVSPLGPLQVQLEPSTPTLEQLWEGRATVTLQGPAGRRIKSRITFEDVDTGANFVTKQLPPLALPITAADWRRHFEKQFQMTREALRSYDIARACVIEFKAAELGELTIRFEREFSPLRWAVRRTGQGYIVRLLDDSGAPDPPVISRLRFESPCVEESIDSDTEFRVPPDGGLIVARQREFTAAVIIPPAAPGLSDLCCDASIEEQIRSINSLIGAVANAELWGHARLPGDLISAVRQRDVLRALTVHISQIVGGDRWANAEASYDRMDGGLNHLIGAVSKRREEAEIGVILAREGEALAAVACEKRVDRIASLATRFRLLPSTLRHSNPDGALDGRGHEQAVLIDAEWFSELALRLVSNPARVDAWAGQNLHTGLKRLLEEFPTLARAARFLVLATNRYLKSSGDPGVLYAGWEWT